LQDFEAIIFDLLDTDPDQWGVGIRHRSGRKIWIKECGNAGGQRPPGRTAEEFAWRLSCDTGLEIEDYKPGKKAGIPIRAVLVWLAVLAGILLILYFSNRPASNSEVIIYAAQDQVYAEPILRQFEKETGIRVRAVFDSEAVKTVGLANRLLAERRHPQCDVFWGNEEMRTRQLAAQGVFRETNGWAAFGYRSRRIVINTNKLALAGSPKSLLELTNEIWRGKVALAFPQFGTTATHFQALRQLWGEERWLAWCRALAANKPFLVDGNSVVVKFVVRGEAWIGLTDSDDIAAGQREGFPIAALDGRARHSVRADLQKSPAGAHGVTRPTEPVNCGGCDNCLAPRATWDGTLAAQKFLSCVYRIREKGGFGVGMNHIVEVLTGADTEKVRKFGHQSLSTYGIGSEHGRAEWGAIGRELVRLGFLLQNTEKFNIIELTDEGRVALKSRQKITLTKPVAAPEPAKHRAGEIACDEALFEKLRQLRKQLADERGVPPYIVFSDVALRQMARFYPQSDAEFSRISGVGDKKLREFGAAFLREIGSHLQTNPRQIFADDSFAEPVAPMRSKLTDTVRETLHFFRQGRTVADIAQIRGLKDSTIYGHLEEAMLAGEAIDVNALLDAQAQKEIAAAFQRFGFGNLSGVVESFGGRYTHGECRVFRAATQNRQRARS
jgi:hypothetical protein